MMQWLLAVRRAALVSILLLPSCGPSSKAVSRDTFGPKWPLTVETGIVTSRAIEDPRYKISAITFTAPGNKVYALNGTAKNRGYIDNIGPIWRDDPELPGMKMDLGPLIDVGLELGKSR